MIFRVILTAPPGPASQFVEVENERKESIRAGEWSQEDGLHVLTIDTSRVEMDRQRLLDLVRHQRGPLHDAELISDEEYAALAADHGAVARLEGYDEARARLATLCADIDRRARGDQEGRVPDAPRTDPLGALASVAALRQRAVGAEEALAETKAEVVRLNRRAH